MQTILPPSGNTIKILGKPKPAEHGLRWMTYVLAQPVEGGVLVFHTLTRALLLLTPEEYAAPDTLPDLRDGWFRVPQEMNDQKYADQVRFIRRTMWKEPERHILQRIAAAKRSICTGLAVNRFLTSRSLTSSAPTLRKRASCTNP